MSLGWSCRLPGNRPKRRVMSAFPISLSDIPWATHDPKRPEDHPQSGLQDLQVGVVGIGSPSQLVTYVVSAWEDAPKKVYYETLPEPPILYVGDLMQQFYMRTYTARAHVTTNIADSSPVIGEIDALRAGVDDEVTPTTYAYERARSLIEQAY